MFNTSFSNKTQLKIKKYFLFYWVGPGSMHFLLWTGPGPAGTVENVSTVHVNNGVCLHCLCDSSAQEAASCAFGKPAAQS
jgi:hypothetical protein